MADHRRPLKGLFADITGDVLGHGGGDGPLGIVLGGRAGEALDVDAMDAIAALQLLRQRVPDLGRGRQAGDQDDVAGRVLGAINADVKAPRLEIGVLVAVGGGRGRGVSAVAVVLGQGRARQGGGGEQGHKGGLHWRGLSVSVPVGYVVRFAL